MSDETLIQGSIEWLQARCGSLGASSIHEAMARTKSGYSSTRVNLRARLVAERLTGIPQETYANAAMQWGTDHEAQARAAYEFFQGAEVRDVGLIRHPTIAGTHASPDGLIDPDGGLEIKAPNTATHINTLLTKTFDDKYIVQCLWGMACTGRKWWDLVSFDPRMPGDLQLFVQRVPWQEARIVALELEVADFLAEVDDMVAKLTGRAVEHLAGKLRASSEILMMP